MNYLIAVLADRIEAEEAAVALEKAGKFATSVQFLGYINLIFDRRFGHHERRFLVARQSLGTQYRRLCLKVVFR